MRNPPSLSAVVCPSATGVECSSAVTGAPAGAPLPLKVTASPGKYGPGETVKLRAVVVAVAVAVVGVGAGAGLEGDVTATLATVVALHVEYPWKELPYSSGSCRASTSISKPCEREIAR